MKKYFLTGVLLFTTLAFSSNVFCFSVENHKLITKLSVDLINNCGVKNDIDISNIEILVEYNLFQDKLLKKAILWHFPMPEEGSNNPIPSKKHASGYGKIVVDTTFNRWTEYLEDQANKENEFEDRLPAIGALLHFTQDLAVPSHAIPIFHPSKIANPDKLDNWDANKLDSKELTKKDDSICSELKNKIKSVASLNKEVRRNTLFSINSKLSICPKGVTTCDWSVLWKTKVTRTGFAYYGCNKEDMFGNNKFTCNNIDYQISTDEYNDYAEKRFSDAIIASAKLILHYLYLKPGGKSQCSDSQWVPRKKHLKCLKTGKGVKATGVPLSRNEKA